jgi:hypothetical protein
MLKAITDDFIQAVKNPAFVGLTLRTVAKSDISIDISSPVVSRCWF